VTLSFSLALPVAFTGDLKAGGDVGVFLTAIDSGIGFTFDSRSFGTASARPALEISALPQPGITSIGVSGTNTVFTATNGAVGGIYSILTSTNLSLSKNQWLPVATNALTTAGNFTVTTQTRLARMLHHNNSLFSKHNNSHSKKCTNSPNWTGPSCLPPFSPSLFLFLGRPRRSDRLPRRARGTGCRAQFGKSRRAHHQHPRRKRCPVAILESRVL